MGYRIRELVRLMLERDRLMMHPVPTGSAEWSLKRAHVAQVEAAIVVECEEINRLLEIRANIGRMEP